MHEQGHGSSLLYVGPSILVERAVGSILYFFCVFLLAALFSTSKDEADKCEMMIVLSVLRGFASYFVLLVHNKTRIIRTQDKKINLDWCVHTFGFISCLLRGTAAASYITQEIVSIDKYIQPINFFYELIIMFCTVPLLYFFYDHESLEN